MYWVIILKDKTITPSDLKVIMHSKRANVYYLEKCRVMQKDGRILYITEAKKEKLYWNIPIANTTVILLGMGTSITQAAMRMLCSAGVMVGFCGTGGTPLYAGTEIEWMSPQNEYRPTKYVQGWAHFWFDEQKRLAVAKDLQKFRYSYLLECWAKDRELREEGLSPDASMLKEAVDEFKARIVSAVNVQELLLGEAAFTKRLYKYVGYTTGVFDFVRDHDAQDETNRFLSHGNYLAYGLAASALWVLGIPYSFAVMHGKTRRGGLVFDAADMIKDTLILPWAFIFSANGRSDQEFRENCLTKFIEYDAMGFMMRNIESMCFRFDP